VTLGIRDDLSGSSLAPDRDFGNRLAAPDVTEALFFGLGSDGTVSGAKATIKRIGERTDLQLQGRSEYDSRKAGKTTISHLRLSPRPILATHGIAEAGFLAVHAPEFLARRDILARARPGATVLVNTPLAPAAFWDSLPREAQTALIDLNCTLQVIHVIDADAIAGKAGLGRRINTVMQACFLALSGVLPQAEALQALKDPVIETRGQTRPRGGAAQYGSHRRGPGRVAGGPAASGGFCHHGPAPVGSGRGRRFRATDHARAAGWARQRSAGQCLSARWHLAHGKRSAGKARHRAGDSDLAAGSVRAVQPLFDDLPACRDPHQDV
jgi:Pyruvate/2-oxoacid:ferredoxin oxidoreductase gamma subunit